MENLRLLSLLEHLCKVTAECGWIEFKYNNSDPDKIGKTVSALSNGACLEGRQFGYLIWGVDDVSHDVIGTTFHPELQKVGSESFHFWLSKYISPTPSLAFKELNHPNGRVVILEIPAAHPVPVKFRDVAYVRIGSATPKLSDYPNIEADLVSKLRPFAWENGLAKDFIIAEDINNIIDIKNYFNMIKSPEPADLDFKITRLLEERIIVNDTSGRFGITNMGAVLFARRLDEFDGISRKALRVVQYDGVTKIKSKRMQEGQKGYASGFSGLLNYIDGALPRSDEIGEDGIRTPRRAFPLIAIRELVANALVHQDMTLTGTGPLVEIFDNRVEISNPGMPVTDIVKKLFGAPPRSRNEHMAALMRRMGLCEELGSGLVKVVDALERSQLPGLDLSLRDSNFKATLVGPLSFADMSREQRIQVCYQHACLKAQGGIVLTNASLRERFGIQERNAAQVSRVIKDALAEGFIRVADPERPKAGYAPYWA